MKSIQWWTGTTARENELNQKIVPRATGMEGRVGVIGRAWRITSNKETNNKQQKK